MGSVPELKPDRPEIFDDKERMKGALEALQKENGSLKQLVVQLSELANPKSHRPVKPPWLTKGPSRMSSDDPAQFREQADYCHRQAQRASDQREKQTWLRIAGDWLEMSADAERRQIQTGANIKAASFFRNFP